VKEHDARVVQTQSSQNGHYCFLWLSLKPNAHPGTLHISLRTSVGATTIGFPLLPRESTTGHYQGISRDDVIYLIMPDRFSDGDPSNDQPFYDRNAPKGYHGGDLRGVRNHLDYLHDLGVSAIWLTPAWKNADSDYHGYGVVDFYALDSHMGTMQDYKDLVSAAHQLGIKVILDYVANHTGPKHPWANDPPTPTWLHGSPGHHLEPAYDFAGIVDPHAAPRESRRTLEGWFAGVLPDLNPDDPLLGLYLAQNAIWWTESATLDGYRLDTRRFMSEARADQVKLKAAFSLLMTMRGIPQIYSGDEIGMPGGDDPDNRRDFPGGFPGDGANAFSAAGRTHEQAEVFSYLQSLLKLRAAHPALRDGQHLHVGWDDTYYAFVRENKTEKLFVVFNNANETRSLAIPIDDTAMEQAKVLTPLLGSPPAQVSGRQVRLSIAPRSLAIYTAQ
jgi:glycosidase